jgi:putative membrane protein
MTASEAPPGGSAPESRAREPAVQLAGGHLHPGMLFLNFLDGLRSSALLAVLAFFSGSMVFGGLVVVAFVAHMTWSVIRFVTFKYRLTTEELVTTEGILHRQERRIPINRIQDLSFEQSLMRRLFGLVVVAVETASGTRAEAKLDSLGRAEAEHLREVLLRQRGRISGGTLEGASALGPREVTLYRASVVDLVMRGLTDSKIGAMLLGLVGVLEMLSQFGLERQFIGSIVDRLSGLGPVMLTLTVVAVLSAGVLGGWMLSVATNLLLFFGFRLVLRGDVLQRRYGMFTARARSLPRRRVQRVLIEQNLLRRLFALVVMRADSAGSGQDERQELKGGLDVVVPLSQPSVARGLLPVLLPDIDREAFAWKPASRAVVARTTLEGVVLAAVGAALAAPALGTGAAAFALLVPVAFAVGLLLRQNLAYATAGEHIALRWGIVGRYYAYIPLRKVQGVVLNASPLERLLRLCRVTVYVAGGSPSRLTNLPFDEGRALKLAIARRAAARRFVW